MNREDGISYPRPLIRTRRGSALLMNAVVLVTLVAIAIASAKVPSSSRIYAAGLVLYVVLNCVATLRVLGVLKALESRTASPDDTMITLFDHSVYLSILAMTAVLAAVRLATG